MPALFVSRKPFHLTKEQRSESLWLLLPNKSVGLKSGVVKTLPVFTPVQRRHLHIDVDRGMFSFMLPEVDDNLLCFVDIEGEIIVAPVHQIRYLIPVLCLILELCLLIV